ncbi:hypothetical protein [Sporomusa aerivorans]|uniref:hypothetical protein n=1 Tax=Sporomusa aerivorans TaxID=204936 RepID=UPI00352A5409
MATTDSITIINTLLGDINAVIPNFTSLVSSYRLLVGAAEEIQRTPGVPFEIFERSVIRYDRAGTLIDLLLELLCCKIAFTTQFLAVTCAPVDIFRLLENCCSIDDPACRTAETIIILEALRQLLGRPCNSCFGPPPEGITPPPPKVPPASPAPAKADIIPSDLETQKELMTEVTPPLSPAFRSPLSRKHI